MRNAASMASLRFCARQPFYGGGFHEENEALSRAAACRRNLRIGHYGPRGLPPVRAHLSQGLIGLRLGSGTSVAIANLCVRLVPGPSYFLAVSLLSRCAFSTLREY